MILETRVTKTEGNRRCMADARKLDVPMTGKIPISIKGKKDKGIYVSNKLECMQNITTRSYCYYSHCDR